MVALFNRFAISMTKKEAHAMSHSGDCRADVEYHLSLPKFQKQFKKIDQALIFEELKEYGAWNAEKLADTRMNQILILWIAAGNILDDLSERGKR